LAGKQNRWRLGWLREVRQALGIPVAELTRKLGINPSVFFRLEMRERQQTVTLWALDRIAKAMDCELVYSIVPKEGTLEELAERQAWERRLHRNSK
jgi:DNA-binding Xre family transcriptional regulator